jgi:hypothetical protein
MSDHLPFLYISWPSDECEVAGCIPSVDHEREAAIQEAWTHGWYPLLGPLKKDSKELETQTKGRDVALWQAIRSLLDLCDAFLIVGQKTSRRQQEELSAFDSGRRGPTFATHPNSTFPDRMKLRSPEVYSWGEAAERKTVEGWMCKTCRRFFGDGEQAERIARWCCVKATPCDQCGVPKQKMYTLCATCRGTLQKKRHAARERAPWNDLPLWCEAEDKWFDHLDAAEDEAAVRISDRQDDANYDPNPDEIAAELEDMELLLSEPVYGREFDADEYFFDDMPDDEGSDGRGLPEAIEVQVRVLNEAVRQFGPLSYHYTDVALDVKVALKPAILLPVPSA